jgi:hypothetical protein
LTDAVQRLSAALADRYVIERELGAGGMATVLADGTVFYVMPFVEGESLRERLNREQQLPVDEAIRITMPSTGTPRRIQTRRRGSSRRCPRTRRLPFPGS